MIFRQEHCYSASCPKNVSLAYVARKESNNPPLREVPSSSLPSPPDELALAAATADEGCGDNEADESVTASTSPAASPVPAVAAAAAVLAGESREALLLLLLLLLDAALVSGGGSGLPSGPAPSSGTDAAPESTVMGVSTQDPTSSLRYHILVLHWLNILVLH